MSEIFSIQVERHCLGGILKFPKIFPEVDAFIRPTDFYQPDHQTIYTVIRSTLCYQGKLDAVLLAQKIKELGIASKGEISIFDYVQSLQFTQIKEEAALDAFKELVWLRIRREIEATGEQIKATARNPKVKTLDEFLATTDKIYNERITSYGNVEGPNDLYGDLKQFALSIEEKEEIGLKTAFPSFNKMFGGIRAANGVYAVVSRPKHGKSTWLLKMSEGCALLNPGLKVLYLDTEMQTDVSKFRALASNTHIPMWFLENGKWKRSPELAKKFNENIDKTQSLAGKIYHMNVAGKPIEEVRSIIRRWYFSTVGRGNPAMVIYDYIKMTGEMVTANWAEYQAVGEKINILNEIGIELNVPIWTACQLNRSAEDGRDDSAAIATSDRLQWFAAFVGIFRRKTLDEIAEYGTQSGSHILIPLATRFQGEQGPGHHDLVKIPGRTVNGKTTFKYKQNFINYNVENFDVQERGTLYDLVNAHVHLHDAPKNDGKLI